MVCGGACTQDRLASLVARLSGADAVQRSDLDALLLRLDGQYPGGDVSALCVAMLLLGTQQRKGCF